MDLKEIIEELAKQPNEIYSQIGIISDVNVSERTCSLAPLDGGVAVYGVRLQASINNDKGVVQIPKDGSTGIVTFINKNTGYLTLPTEVESVLVDSESVVFNGGDNGGLIKINELILELQKNTAILTAIKAAVSVPIPEAGNGSPSSLGQALNVALSSLSVGSFTNIENDKIKH